MDARTHSPIDPATPNFADPSFDPVDFLNENLPPLTLASSQPHASRSSGSVPLGELSPQVQSLLSQINALNVRHSSTLDGLTDEILRSGGRLAYEVEVLRGEAIGLSDTLNDALHDDIVKFIPEGLEASATVTDQTHTPPESSEASQRAEEKNQKELSNGTQAPRDPEYITKLRTLNQVRTRLDDVIRTFGEAMKWPIPPSETSLASSFITVSAPEAAPDMQILEEKGQEVAGKLRDEVVELLNSQGGGEAGIEAASHRVKDLRTLTTLWKGTAEEKPRLRFVDGLARIVDDRRKEFESKAKDSSSGGKRQGGPTAEQNGHNEGGSGFLWNLQRLRDEIYLD